MKINTKRGVAPIAILIISLIVLLGGGYGIKKIADKKAENKLIENGMPVPGTNTPDTEVFGETKTLQITLNEQNTSGQSGQAVITQIGTSTIKVILNITGRPSSVDQPAHIHIGSCPNGGAVKYPLTNVSSGASQTEIPITLTQLLSELPLAINVHKSTTDTKTYTSCGDIIDKQTNNAEIEKVTKVNYTSAGFSPRTITIKKGEAVLFENKTGKTASIASDEHPSHLLYPEFDQYKTSERGKTEFKFIFEKIGTWKYHDHLNEDMTGTVIVTE